MRYFRFSTVELALRAKTSREFGSENQHYIDYDIKVV